MVGLPNLSNRSFSIILLVTAIFLILLTLTRPSSSSLISQVFHSGVSSSNTPQRSAWFSGAGYLRFDGVEGWNTIYETRSEGAKGYSCDGETILKGGGTLCLSTLKLTRAIYDNSMALSRSLQALPDQRNATAEETLRRSYLELDGLRGKRVLHLGDSTDRFPVDEWADRLPTGSKTIIVPETGEIIPEIPISESRHTTRFTNIRLVDSSSSPIIPEPGLKDPLHPDDLRMDFLFSFGAMDFASPQAYSDRIDLLDPILGPNIHYDLICVNAGLWDLEFFAREEPKIELTFGITSDFVDRYIEKYVGMIGILQSRYGPNTPIAIRLTHDLAHDWDLPKFKPLRSEHLRQAQMEVIRRTGARLLPFGDLMRSQPFYYLSDGYHPGIPANMLHMETILRILAER